MDGWTDGRHCDTYVEHSASRLDKNQRESIQKTLIEANQGEGWMEKKNSQTNSKSQEKNIKNQKIKQEGT